jgi:hypothetical protein
MIRSACLRIGEFLVKNPKTSRCDFCWIYGFDGVADDVSIFELLKKRNSKRDKINFEPSYRLSQG